MRKQICSGRMWRYFLVFWMIGVLPVSLFSQKEAIRPLLTQNPVPGILPKEPALNPEYEMALQEYEALIKKYPDIDFIIVNTGINVTL